MFLQTARLHPAKGKLGELREIMTEQITHAQERGEQVALRERILSDEGAALVVGLRYGSLVELDEGRRARTADAAFQAHLARVVPLLDRPILIGLEERIVAAASTPATVRLVTRAFIEPVVGRAGRLRAMLEEATAQAHAAGIGSQSLSQTVLSATGTGFRITNAYEDMASLERHHHERASARAAFVERASELIRTPIAVRLFEVIVPFR